MNKTYCALLRVSLVLFLGLGTHNPPSLTLAARPAQTPPCPAFAPHAQSEVLAPEFEVVVTTDGIQVRGRSEFAANTPLKAFEWSLDISNCTYTTKLIEARDQAPQANLHTQVNATLRGSAAPTGDYFAGVQIVSEDPFDVPLAATTNKLYWATYSNGTVHWYQYTGGCEGYATGITHWYMSNCLYSSPYYEAGNTLIRATILANYYNYDFVDPALRTDVMHYSQIVAYNNGAWAHVWSALHSGEYSWFLRGEVIPEQP